MKSPLLRACLLSVVVFGALGCGDPTSPAELLADRFDGLAAKLTAEDQYRKNALRVAAHTLRRGAPINTVNIAVGSTTRTFSAVAIQVGFDTDTDYLNTTVVAWRGSNADELLHLVMYGSDLQFPDTTATFEDTAVYVGNLVYDHFYFMKGTSEVWYRRSGEGHLDVISEGATCQPLKSNHTCKSIQVGVDFSVKTRLGVEDETITERNVATPRVTLKAIRYLKKCQTSGGSSTSCWVSLVSED